MGANPTTSYSFAMIVLPRMPLDWNTLAPRMDFGGGLAYSQTLPLPLDQHWKDSIGSMRADLVTHSALTLIASKPVSTPQVSDADRMWLDDSVNRFYQSLLLAAPMWIDGEVVRLSGMVTDDKATIKQITTFTPNGTIHFGQKTLVDANALQLAAEMVPILNGFPPETYQRLCRILNAYFEGIRHNSYRERLHHFTRCIEGLILADQGQTTSQFKSRTELFVGPKEHDYMGRVYDNRSAAEHMNDPIVVGATDLEKRRDFWIMVLLVEEVARFCIRNVLLSKQLLPYFKDVDAMSRFWALDKPVREKLWGHPLSLPALRQHIDMTEAFR